MPSSQLRRGLRSAIALCTCITLTSTTACGPGLGGDDSRELVPRKGGGGGGGGNNPDGGHEPPPNPDDLPVPEDPVVPISGVSRLEGAGRVSPTGAFQYSIPLWVPQGRAGMEPELTLAYSSHGGNGIAGVGWSLSPGPSISRCNQVMARDFVVDNPQYDNDDNFCLGGQKLVEVPAPPEDPTGAAPAIPNVLAEYRTERESFARVVALGSSTPESWMVFRPSGQIEHYGTTGEGRVEGFRADGSSIPVTLAWRLERADDRNGNEVHYEWEPDPTGSASRRLDQIRYTVSAGGPYFGADERRVDLVYEDRPDPLEAWVNGLALRTSQRLSRVEMWAPVDGNAQRVRHYELSYEDSKRTFRSLLTSARFCDSTDACTKPTVFEYAEPTGLQAVEYKRTPGTSIGGLNPKWFTDLQVFDLNGDGYDDILYDTVDGGLGVVDPPMGPSYEVWVNRAHPRARLSDGSFGDPFTTPVDLGPLFPNPSWDSSEGVWYGREIGKTTASRLDADGDGQVEWATKVIDDGEPLLRRYSLDPQTNTVSAVPGSDLPCNKERCTWQPLDFDGDGDPDVARYTVETDDEGEVVDSVVAIFENDGSGALTMGPFIQDFGPEIRSVMGMDHEGNGTSDILPLDEDRRFGVFGQREGVAYNLAPGGESMRGGTLADINGDGLRDLVWPFGRPPEDDPQVPTSAGPEISINTGMGFLPPTVTAALAWPPAAGGGDFPSVATDFTFDTRVADFNGDGRDDILILRHALRPDDVDYPVFIDETLFWVFDEDEPLMLMLSTGDGFELNPLHDPRHVVFHPYAKWGATKLGDADGDGRPEILSVSHPGTGSDPVIKPSSCYPGVDPASEKFHSCYDGFYIEIGTQDIEPLLPSAFDKVIEVRDGYGATETVHYGRGATDPGHPDPLHTPANDCTRPERCLVKTGDLVKTHTVGPRSWQYRYHGGRANVTGRGALGFDRVVITDQVDMSELELEYDLSGVLTLAVGHVYPLVGMPVATTRTIEDEGRVYTTRTENSYRVEYLSNRYYVVPKSSVQSTRQDGVEHSSTETSVEYDDFANPIYRSVKRGNLVQIAEYYYDNDTTDWLLGLLRRQELTEMTPDESVVRVVEYDYDGSGLLAVSRIEPDTPGDATVYAEIEVDRDAAGLLVGGRVRDALGEVRSGAVQYDSDGVYAQVVVDPLGQVSVAKFDARVDAAIATADINGAVTQHVYDGLGRARSTEYPTGLIETLAYDDSLASVSLTAQDNTGRSATQGFDPYMRLMAEQWVGFDGAPVHVTYTRDELGRPLAQTLPRFEGAPSYTVVQTYDNLGRPSVTTYPDATEERWRYPSLATAEHIDAHGRSTLSTTTPDGLEHTLVRYDSGAPTLTRTTFGPFALPRRLQSPSASSEALAPVVTMEYDVLGRRTHLHDPNTGTLQEGYNAFGELVEQIAANGFVREVEYDALGRTTTRTSEDGVDTFVYGTSPGARGNLVSATSADGVAWAATYDTLGRPVSETYEWDGESWSFEQTYDSVGRALETTYPVMPDGTRARVRSVYDGSGALSQIREEVTGTTLFEVELRDASSRITRSNRNGLVEVVHDFDPITGRLAAARATSVLGGSDVLDLSYEYYDDGRIEERTDTISNIVDAHVYDDLGRLTRWDSTRQGGLQSRSYAFDDDGRLADVTDVTASGTPSTTSYAYPAPGAARPHAAQTIGGRSYKYDALGREKKASGAGFIRKTAYNSRNLPKVVTTSTAVAKFEYDPFGRRFFKAGTAGERVFVGGLYERSTTSAGEVHRMNVAGPEGMVAVLEWQPSDPITYLPTYVLQDERGAAAVTTDHKGIEQERLFYDPSGARLDAQGNLANAGASMEPLPGYSGHLYDDELALIDMKGRIFDPHARKFLTPDPVLDNYGAGRGLDRYGLVGFDSINKVDPTGFQAAGGCSADVCFADDHLVGWPSDDPLEPIPLPGNGEMNQPSEPPAGGGNGFIYGDYGADLFFYAIPALDGPASDPLPLPAAKRIFRVYPFLVDSHNQVANPNARDIDLLILDALGTAAEAFGTVGVASVVDGIIFAEAAGHGEAGHEDAMAMAPGAGLPANGVRISRRANKIGRNARRARRRSRGVRFRRWKRGEPIDKPLVDGSLPGWRTVRSRYWKNRYEHAKSTDEFTRDPIMGKHNLERMRRGAAPLDFNPRTRRYEARELHHVWPQRLEVNDGPVNLWEVTPDQHALIDGLRRRSGL